MSLCKRLKPPFLFSTRPSRYLNSPLPPLSLPFLYPSSWVGTHSNAGRDNCSVPGSIPDYDDDADIPFEPSLPAQQVSINDGQSHRVALDSNDPWAFLQGRPLKAAKHHIPTYRAMPQRGSSLKLGKWRERPWGPQNDVDHSTLTEREREIFTQIFNTILSEKSSFHPQTVPAQSFPSSSLNALFESAVGPLQRGSEISFSPRDSIDKESAAASLAMASSFEQFSPLLRRAAATAAGLILPRRNHQEALEIQQQLGARIRDMNACETDLELGQWMDEHVFSMVEKEGVGSSFKGFPPIIYAYLLAEGMKILRQTFNDLPSVISVFERIKKLGAESYVVGCSVYVYNQVIAAKWEGYRDLYRVKDLVDEMERNGIQGDKNTVKVLHEIMQDVSAMNSHNTVHAMFTEGNESLLNDLTHKTQRWEMPQTGDSITGSLKGLLA